MFKKEFVQGLKEISESSSEAAAVATVVRREAPTSSKPGDKALILADGKIKGWVGGGCTRGIVIKEALASIKDRTPRLVKIQADFDAREQQGVKNYKMTCMSGGTVEVFIEPITPTMEIQIFGRSHIARALCEIGHAAGFSITVISALANRDMFVNADTITSLDKFTPGKNHAYNVVCTQGEDDTQHLKAALETGGYVSFVSSKRKANSILMALKREGVAHESLAAIKTPAGLDINAKTPEEVAISILAQIIENYRSSGAEEEDNGVELTDELYINPVCNIPVHKSSAKHVLDYQGEKVYFCCDGCKVSFEADPKKYMPA